MKSLLSAVLLSSSLLLSGAARAEEGTGRVYGIEDAGYPMYNVTIELRADEAMDFTANAEELGFGGRLPSLEGEYVAFQYDSNEETALMDMRLKGRSLLGSDAPEASADWMKVTGKLSGADEVTSSDLPGEITITQGTGSKTKFEYFITPEIMAANGQVVTVLYDRRQTNRLTFMEVQ